MIAVALLICIIGVSWATPFKTSELTIKINHVDGMKIADFNADGTQDIMLVGRADNKQKQLQLIPLTNAKVIDATPKVVELPNDILFYDVGRLAGEEKATLVFMLPGKVVRYDVLTQRLFTLVQTQSIYRASHLRTTAMGYKPFLQDVNNDGLSDILLTDFTQSYLFIQQSNGDFTAIKPIEMPAQMRLFRNNNAVYFTSPVQLSDVNFDGELDLVYQVNRKIHVFFQYNGQFAAKAQVIPVILEHPLDDEYDDFKKDQSNLVTHKFYKLMDLNNDHILDLITQVTKSSGLLDKQSQYQFYFGRRNEADGQAILSFDRKPDSVISSQGMQFELTLVDFDGDDKLDLVSPSYELGVGSIIASLFSSSADLDIMFHPLSKNSRYDIKPSLEKELTVDFNLSSGQQVYPLLKINDFNGDGRNDLLIGNGSKRIYLYKGDFSRRLFARKAEKFSVKLPRNARLIEASDLNNDGKTDLVIRYDKLDSEATSRMKILLAQ
jgi:hypothetical protein